jgi:hypothetical protein
MFSNIWQHPKTSAAGVLIAIVAIAGVFSQQGVTLGNAGTGTVVALVAACATALLGLLARDPQVQGSEIRDQGSAGTPQKLGMIMLVAILCACWAASPARAQAAAPAAASTGFVASTDVLAIGGPSGWSAGNRTNEDYDLLEFGATKSNRLFLEGVELLAPSAGFSIYGGGVKLQPDISSILKKTNLPTGNFLAFLDGSVGNTIYATGPNHVGVIVGGGLQYITTSTMTWNTLRFDEILAGGKHYPSLSTGISLYFGGTPASAAASPNVKRSLLRRIATATAATK